MKVLKWIGIFVLGFAAAFLVLTIVLKLLFPAERIKSIVVPQVEKILERDVSIEGAGISVYPVLGVKLRGVEVSNTDREGFSDDPFVKFQRFLAGVKVLPLLKKEVKIKDIRLINPEFLVEIDTSGSYNFDDLGFMKEKGVQEQEDKPGKQGLPLLPVPVSLEHLSIKDASLIYRDKSSGNEISIDTLNQRVDFSIDKELRDITSTGELSVKGIFLNTPLLKKPLDGLEVTFNHNIGMDYRAGVIRIKEIRASLQKLFLTLTGSVSGIGATPEIDLKVDMDRFTLGDVISEIPPEMFPEVEKLSAGGDVDFKIAAKGRIDSVSSPNLKGQIAVSDGNIKHSDLPQSVKELETDLSFTDSTLNMKKFNMNIGPNPVKAKLIVKNFAEPVIDGMLKATVDLSVVKNAVKLPEGTSLAGNLKADITANGKVDPENLRKMNVSGGVSFDKIKVKTKDLLKPALIDGSAELNPFSIESDVDMKVGESDMSVSSEIKNYFSFILPDSVKQSHTPSLDFRIKSSFINYDEIFAEKDESAQSGEAKGIQSEVSPLILAAPLPNINISGKVRADKLIYKGIETERIRAELNKNKNNVEFSADARMYDGRIDEDLRLDAANIHDLKIDNQFYVRRVDVNKLISNFNDLLPDDMPLAKDIKELDNSIYGTATVESSVKSSGGTVSEVTDNLDGVVKGSVDDGKITKGAILKVVSSKLSKYLNLDVIEFDDMETELIIKDKKVFIDEFTMESSVGDWESSGNIGFDASLDMELSNRFTRKISAPIVKIEEKGKGAVKSAVKGSKLEGVAGDLLDKSGIADDDGRVTVLMQIGGTASKPSIKGFRFVKHKGEGRAQKSAKESIRETAEEELKKAKKKYKKKLKETADKKKEKVKKAAEKEVKKAEKKVKKKVEEEAGKEAADKADKEIKKAKDKLKGMF